MANKDWSGNGASTFKCLGASNHTDHDREEHDYYATSPEAAEWLLKIEPEIKDIWECSVGGGHLAEPLRKAGKLKAVSDLVDRGYHPEGIRIKYPLDFLKCSHTWNGDIVTNPPYRCYDKETQVKTKEGWKYFYELKGTEEILSVNPDTLEVEWSNIITKHEYDYNGFLIHFKNKVQDIMVTPNHKMFVFKESTLKNKGYLEGQKAKDEFFTANKVNKNSITPQWDYRWQGNNINYFLLEKCYKKISKKSEKLMPELKIPMDNWLKFFGMWIADGWCSHTLNTQGNQRYSIGIKQNKVTYKETKDIFDSLPFKYKINKDKNKEEYSFIIENKQLWLYLSKFGYSRDKYIPTFIKDLPQEKLKTFFKFYLLGDSSKIVIGKEKHKCKTWGCRVSTVSERMIEDLHEIVLKLGYLVTSINTCQEKTCLLYYFNYYKEKKNQNNYIRYNTKKLKEYEGKVYCITLEKNGFMLVRRNNKICFCGNSALEFIKNALKIVPDGRKVCMFLKLTFLEGKGRKKFFEENPPQTCWISSSRIVCAMNGEFEKDKKDKNGKILLDKNGNILKDKQASAVCYMWAVWQKGYKGDTIIKWFN